MGLQMTYKIGGDLPITAYFRIQNISIYHNPPEVELLKKELLESKKEEVNPDKKEVAIENKKHIVHIVDAYISSGKGKNVLEVLRGNWRFIYDESIKESILVQAYNYLKTLPEFKGAFDVLEE